MLEQLSERFSHLTKRLKGEARLTEENIEGALRDVRMALLEADVAIAVVKAFIANVKERALGEEVKGSLTPGQAFIKVVYEELVRLMGEEKKRLISHIALRPCFLLACKAVAKPQPLASWHAILKKTTKKGCFWQARTSTGQRRSRN